MSSSLNGSPNEEGSRELLSNHDIHIPFAPSSRIRSSPTLCGFQIILSNVSCFESFYQLSNTILATLFHYSCPHHTTSIYHHYPIFSNIFFQLASVVFCGTQKEMEISRWCINSWTCDLLPASYQWTGQSNPRRFTQSSGWTENILKEKRK